MEGHDGLSGSSGQAREAEWSRGLSDQTILVVETLTWNGRSKDAVRRMSNI
jgi:hypothetical protein